ncbi:hypothetical protein [Pseudorhodoferax sp. Leaf274]|uniref:hypothetical protein n=1 Tax=Pseudorhodoferax sp. Leaf274 TaxID=1736318 RepID=UPI0012E1AE7D|nr:hypothetical protein [Pseudorhodoferax sp. Leaf274]
MPDRRLMWIVWPAFLAACVLETMVFALVDPHDLHWLGRALDWSAMAVYTASFFGFWAVAMACSALTLLLATPEPVSGRPGD